MSNPQTGRAALPCAGDLDPAAAWQRLAADPAAVLVDVRTRIEQALVGSPDLAPLSRQPLCVEWVTQQGRNPDFVAQVQAGLAARGAGPDTTILFMCRSGGRSLIAAGELAAVGFRACYNVAEGFEGDLDRHGHRNSVNGWRARGLPWKQT